MLVAVYHQRVPGIVSALEPDNEVRMLGKKIDDLALSLIAPLRADYDNVRHIFLSPQARILCPINAHGYPDKISN